MDSLVRRFKSEQGNLLFINDPGQNAALGHSDPLDYVLVLTLTDSIRSSLAKEIVIGVDTAFVFSKNQYSLFTNKKSIDHKDQNPRKGPPKFSFQNVRVKKRQTVIDWAEI